MITIQEIHDSLVNGQRKQAIKQIDLYGLYDFWNDYKDFLHDLYFDSQDQIIKYFTDMTISYFRIKNR